MRLAFIVIGVLGFVGLGLRKLLSRQMEDFYVFYSGAVVFAEGGNPYLKSSMRTALGFLPDTELGMQLTLPGMFALLNPVSYLSLEMATVVWACLNLVGFALALFLLAKISRIQTWTPIFCIFICFGLLLGPFHSTLWLGNTDILALAFTVSALYVVERKNNQVIAGFLLGIAMILKIHSTGLFAFYYLARGNIKMFIVSLGTWIATNLAAAAYLTITAPSWFLTWRATSQSAENDYNKVVSTNLDINQLIHLKAGLFGITKNEIVSGIVALAVCLTLLIIFLRTVFRKGDKNLDSTSLLAHFSIVALISLLIVYHKFYGAVFLIFPIAWALLVLGTATRPRKLGYLSLLLISGSIINGQILFTQLLDNGSVPNFIASSGIITGLLQFHFVWILFGVLSLVLLSLRKIRGACPPPGNTLG